MFDSSKVNGIQKRDFSVPFVESQNVNFFLANLKKNTSVMPVFFFLSLPIKKGENVKPVDVFSPVKMPLLPEST